MGRIVLRSHGHTHVGRRLGLAAGRRSSKRKHHKGRQNRRQSERHHTKSLSVMHFP